MAAGLLLNQIFEGDTYSDWEVVQLASTVYGVENGPGESIEDYTKWQKLVNAIIGTDVDKADELSNWDRYSRVLKCLLAAGEGSFRHTLATCAPNSYNVGSFIVQACHKIVPNLSENQKDPRLTDWEVIQLLKGIYDITEVNSKSYEKLEWDLFGRERYATELKMLMQMVDTENPDGFNEAISSKDPDNYYFHQIATSVMRKARKWLKTVTLR